MACLVVREDVQIKWFDSLFGLCSRCLLLETLYKENHSILTFETRFYDEVDSIPDGHECDAKKETKGLDSKFGHQEGSRVD